jgi:hypothetical protein
MGTVNDPAAGPIAAYGGTVVVRLRIRTYHSKGTTGGEMSVYPEFLRFRGAGIHRWELRTYDIKKSAIDQIHVVRTSDVPPLQRLFPMIPIRQYGISVASKPGGSFKDRDTYRFTFDAPELAEVLGTLRAAGYPISEMADS